METQAKLGEASWAKLVEMAEAYYGEGFPAPLDMEVVAAVRAHAKVYRKDPQASVVMGWIAGYLVRRAEAGV